MISCLVLVPQMFLKTRADSRHEQLGHSWDPSKDRSQCAWCEATEKAEQLITWFLLLFPRPLTRQKHKARMLSATLGVDKTMTQELYSGDVLMRFTVSKYKGRYHSRVYKRTKLEPAHTERHEKNRKQITRKPCLKLHWWLKVFHDMLDTHTPYQKGNTEPQTWIISQLIGKSLHISSFSKFPQ